LSDRNSNGRNRQVRGYPSRRWRRWSGAEIRRFRVMGDQRVGRLLGRELKLLGQCHADPLPVEQPHELRAVLQVWAGRVAERVPAAAVSHPQDAVDGVRVVTADAKRLAYPRVPELREGLGKLNREPVQLQVVPVGVLGEQLGGGIADLRA